MLTGEFCETIMMLLSFTNPRRYWCYFWWGLHQQLQYPHPDESMSSKSWILSSVWCSGSSLDRTRTFEVSNQDTMLWSCNENYSLSDSTLGYEVWMKPLWQEPLTGDWRNLVWQPTQTGERGNDTFCWIIEFYSDCWQVCGNIFWRKQEEIVNCYSSYWKPLHRVSGKNIVESSRITNWSFLYRMNPPVAWVSWRNFL